MLLILTEGFIYSTRDISASVIFRIFYLTLRLSTPFKLKISLISKYEHKQILYAKDVSNIMFCDKNWHFCKFLLTQVYVFTCYHCQVEEEGHICLSQMSLATAAGREVEKSDQTSTKGTIFVNTCILDYNMCWEITDHSPLGHICSTSLKIGWVLSNEKWEMS